MIQLKGLVNVPVLGLWNGRHIPVDSRVSTYTVVEVGLEVSGLFKGTIKSIEPVTFQSVYLWRQQANTGMPSAFQATTVYSQNTFRNTPQRGSLLRPNHTRPVCSRNTPGIPSRGYSGWRSPVLGRPSSVGGRFPPHYVPTLRATHPDCSHAKHPIDIPDDDRHVVLQWWTIGSSDYGRAVKHADRTRTF